MSIERMKECYERNNKGKAVNLFDWLKYISEYLIEQHEAKEVGFGVTNKDIDDMTKECSGVNDALLGDRVVEVGQIWRNKTTGTQYQIQSRGTTNSGYYFKLLILI